MPSNDEYEREPGGIPRWVKVAAIIVLLLALLFLVLRLVGAEHGPWQHVGSPVVPESAESLGSLR